VVPSKTEGSESDAADTVSPAEPPTVEQETAAVPDEPVVTEQEAAPEETSQQEAAEAPVEATASEESPQEAAVDSAASTEVEVAASADTPAEEQAAPASTEEASTTPEEEPTAGERPQFAGLGSAVIKPPPGYDPTNPTTWRRPAEPAAPKDKEKPSTTGRRRRVASPGGGGQGRNRGRSRSGNSYRDNMQGKSRKRATGAKGSGTVAMKAEKRKVRIDNTISVGQLAHEMQIKATVVIRHLMELGTMVTVNEMLDMDTASLIASEFGYEVENIGFQEEVILGQNAEVDDEEGQESRPPVVTIMGHVDHGKTTLLDAIRETKVAAGEAGGITQHIGAYQVVIRDQSITFLDTPGHAAFTAMRARGASLTDVVVLVVAADDGVQDQTAEAISHAKAAGVPIIVAVNKMDRPGVSAEPIMTRLSDYELVPEAWGGETQFVQISALKREGLDELLESILLQTELLELTANSERPAEGIVIEAKMERGKGTVVTALVQRGTLKQGDNLVIGTAYGRVRAMVDFQGKKIKVAPPSTPVELFGLNGLPQVGDSVIAVASEKDARVVSGHRSQARREEQFGSSRRRTAEDLFQVAAMAHLEYLHVVLKADVQGSVEAVRYALEAVEIEGTELRILHAGVGNINESDVNLIAANGGLLLGFNVRIDAKARKTAESVGLKPEIYKVIYDIIDRVTKFMKGLKEPEFEEVHRGSVEVRAIFKISRIGTVAGSFVTDGRVMRNDSVRVHRGGKQIWSGPISTLKRFKDDVKEVAAGYECGIALDGFNELEEGDILEAFSMEEVDIG